MLRHHYNPGNYHLTVEKALHPRLRHLASDQEILDSGAVLIFKVFINIKRKNYEAL